MIFLFVYIYGADDRDHVCGLSDLAGTLHHRRRRHRDRRLHDEVSAAVLHSVYSERRVFCDAAGDGRFAAAYTDHLCGRMCSADRMGRAGVSRLPDDPGAFVLLPRVLDGDVSRLCPLFLLLYK